VATRPEPGAVAAPAAVDEQARVQDALRRYQRAYSALDVSAAQAVWPAVDRAALARAFDGLASQTLTFENCDVRVDGNAAAAMCRGTTQYVPKVGSRAPRVEPRRWSFSLTRDASDWKIESARAER
jgi:hypothetical protein